MFLSSFWSHVVPRVLPFGMRTGDEDRGDFILVDELKAGVETQKRS